MIPPIDDTITAQASARGAAYRGIVRVSGPDALAVLRPWFRVSANIALLGEVAGSDSCEQHPFLVDGELILWGEELPVPTTLYYWPEGQGFTGQQAVELHTTGSQPLLDTIIQSLCESGCRLAGPGEFTLRAFLSGRIDLPQAEAVLGVIDADDRRQLEVALRQLAGGIGRPLATIRERLLEMTCLLEAELDFADEEIAFLDRSVLRQELESTLQFIQLTRRQMQQRTSTSERPRVVLLGRPNVGKSRLFNTLVELCSAAGTSSAALSHKTPAIVSPQPGTTRDWLEAELQIGELSLTLLDTAGIEAVETIGHDPARQQAQAASRDAIAQAELVLLCVETGTSFTRQEQEFLCENADRILIIRTKSDLYDTDNNRDRDRFHELPVIATSTETGEGLLQLRNDISFRLQRGNCYGEVVPATALRCRESLSCAAEALGHALHLTEPSGDDLLIVTEMRIALEHIGQMTGAVHNDEILDHIFSRFCIGK